VAGRIEIEWSLTQFAGGRIFPLGVLLAYNLRDAVGKLAMGRIDRDKAMKMAREVAAVKLPILVQYGEIRDFEFVCDDRNNTERTPKRALVFEIKVAPDGSAAVEEMHAPFVLAYKDKVFTLSLLDNRDSRSVELFDRIGKVLLDRFRACLTRNQQDEIDLKVGRALDPDCPKMNQDQVEALVDKHFPETPALRRARAEREKEGWAD